MSSIRGSIDIGSNSCLLIIFEKIQSEMIILESHSRVTALGRDLDKSGLFHDESMKDTYNTLMEYKEIIMKYNLSIHDFTVTATEASRVASNSKHFYERVKNEIGFNVTLLSAQGEAYYSTMGILCDEINHSEIIVMDIGGASTELIRVDTNYKKMIESFSMPVGAVRLTNWSDKDEKLSEVLTSFDKQLETSKTSTLYCVAGTMTSVANMLIGNKNFVESEVHGFKGAVDDIINLYNDIKDLDPSKILSIYPFLGKRSKTIVAGIRLALTIIDRLSVREVYVSTYGLRFGTAISSNIDKEYIINQ